MLNQSNLFLSLSDLKAFHGCISFYYNLLSLNKLTLEKNVKVLQEVDLEEEFRRYFTSRKIYGDQYHRYYTKGFFHLWFFLTIYDSSAKSDTHYLPFYFHLGNVEEAGHNYVVYNGQKTHDFFEVVDAFNKLLKYWFALPSLINDFYKYNSENYFSYNLEAMLFQHGIQLPSVIHQLRNLILHHEPEALIFKSYEKTRWRPGPKVEFFDVELDSYLRHKGDDPSYHCFSGFSVLDDEEIFYPQTKSLLKVYKEKGSNPPETIFQLIDLYKEGLKDGDEDVKYFLQFFEENKSLITEPIIPEAMREVLVYNPPFPMSLLKATVPQTEEELDAGEEAREEWERRYFQD